MIVVDRTLALAGHAASRIERRAGKRGLWAVVLVLFAVSAVPSFLIGSSKRPTDLTFDDVRLDRIPAMTSWVRVEGDLRFVSSGAIYFYRLYDPDHPTRYIVVTSRAPLEEGPGFVTGTVSPGASSSDNVGTIDNADVPPVPKRNEPYGVILLPAVLGIALLVGRRVGYPVVRGDRPATDGGRWLAVDERIPARWSGRIGSEVVGRAVPRPCTVGVSSDPDLTHLSVVDEHAERTVSIRRHTAPVRPIRTCHVRGAEPGLEIHSQASDLVLVLPDGATRDRLLATLR